MTNPSSMNIEFDLKEILARLENRFDKLDEKIEGLNIKIDRVVADGSEFKLHLVKTEEEIKAEIRVLDATIQGIAKRIDNQEFINRGVIVGLVLAVLGGFAKLFGWVS